MNNPWISRNWRRHCKSVIIEAWDKKLREEADSKDMLELINTTNLTTAKPHNIYKYAGLDSNNVRKCTAQIWFLLGVYHTNELLYKMGKSKINICPKCQCGDSIYHVILHCQEFAQIRKTFVSELTEINANIKTYLDL